MTNEQRLDDVLAQLKRAAVIDCKLAVAMLTQTAIILHNRIQRSRNRRDTDVQIIGWSVAQ